MWLPHICHIIGKTVGICTVTFSYYGQLFHLLRFNLDQWIIFGKKNKNQCIYHWVNLSSESQLLANLKIFSESLGKIRIRYIYTFVVVGFLCNGTPSYTDTLVVSLEKWNKLKGSARSRITKYFSLYK